MASVLIVGNFFKVYMFEPDSHHSENEGETINEFINKHHKHLKILK